jgi:segregation and condensation protein B
MDKSLLAIIENLLFAAGEPLSFAKLYQMLYDYPQMSSDLLQEALNELMKKYQEQSIDLKLLPGGYCMQTRAEFSPWIQRIWEEKPKKYSSALLEVLAIIAYDQPLTRGDIEHKRGVAVASPILKTLLEREWIKVVGHRDSPGRPALYATTTHFLNYFNLSNLDELPKLEAE